jgi:hypothetical protein
MDLRQIKLMAFAFACVSLLPLPGNAQDTPGEKHTAVVLRMIGHQLLLNAGDSTSRVLPVILSDDQYRVEFESEFGFIPDELVGIVNRVVSESQMVGRFILEVEQCETGEVVYAYEMGAWQQPNVVPCQERALPRDCYSLLFTVMRPGAGHAAVNNADTADGPNASFGFITAALLFLLMLPAVYFFWKRRNKPDGNSNFISLGTFQFDKRNTALLKDQQRIALTSKEADLLLLLHNSANKTVEREQILRLIWGDEGDYIGRTLDVFISKLRKKLSLDPNVKIVNIRGVGYKLVMDG